jgi:hypothetical protein
MTMSEKCVVCGRRYTPSHRCPKSVLALYDEAERLANLLDDPDGPTLEELIENGLNYKKFARYRLFLE